MLLKLGTYKVIGELQARGIGGGIFEVDDNELLVLICRQEQRRLCGRLHAKKVAILSLETSQHNISQYSRRRTYIIVREHQLALDLSNST